MARDYSPSAEVQLLRYGIGNAHTHPEFGHLLTNDPLRSLDHEERNQQYEITEALWRTIRNKGIRENFEGRIAGILKFESSEEAESFAKHRGEDWAFSIAAIGKEFKVTILTPVFAFNRIAFLTLTNVLLFDAVTFNGRLEGLKFDADFQCPS